LIQTEYARHPISAVIHTHSSTVAGVAMPNNQGTGRAAVFVGVRSCLKESRSIWQRAIEGQFINFNQFDQSTLIAPFF
jgi:hypothetical protein